MHGLSSAEGVQSELHGQESAANVNPWQALFALLLASNPNPSKAFTISHGAPLKALSHSGSAATVQGTAVNRTLASSLASSRVVSRGAAPEMVWRVAQGLNSNFESDELVQATQARMMLPEYSRMIERGSKVRVLRPDSSWRLQTGTVATINMDAAFMLDLMDNWILDDEVRKPCTEDDDDETDCAIEDDDTADACMVPIEIDWLNERICALEGCPVTLKEDFEAVWEAVAADGEGCVTVRRLRDKIEDKIKFPVAVRFDERQGLMLDYFAVDELEKVDAQQEKKKD